MNDSAYSLVHAFPQPLWAEAKAPVERLLQKIKPPDKIWSRLCTILVELLLQKIKPPDVTHGNEGRSLLLVTVEGHAVSIPNRLYDGRRTIIFYDEEPFRAIAELGNAHLTERQRTMLFCLLSRHHNGFVREAALCRIAAAPEAFVVPFVVQLASEYVYEILVQIRLRIPELDRRLYGEFFKANPNLLPLLKQRMISYWNCYYRWDYTSPDGELRYDRHDRYVGFEIFDTFDAMLKEAEA